MVKETLGVTSVAVRTDSILEDSSPVLAMGPMRQNLDYRFILTLTRTMWQDEELADWTEEVHVTKLSAASPPRLERSNGWVALRGDSPKGSSLTSRARGRGHAPRTI